MSSDPPPYTTEFWATDLFHPSATGYRDWAEWAVDEAWERGLGGSVRTDVHPRHRAARARGRLSFARPW